MNRPEDTFLQFHINCMEHTERGELQFFGFDGLGQIYLQGLCPEGHTFPVTVTPRDEEKLKAEAIKRIRERLPPSEEEIERIAQDLDQMGEAIWDELDEA